MAVNPIIVCAQFGANLHMYFGSIYTLKKGGNAMHVWGRGRGFIDVYDVPIKYADQS